MKKTFTKIIFGILLSLTLFNVGVEFVSAQYTLGADTGTIAPDKETQKEIDKAKAQAIEDEYVNTGSLTPLSDIKPGNGSDYNFDNAVKEVQKTLQCDFTVVQKMNPCLTEEEKKKFMKTVLEESIDTVDVSQYSEGGVEVRQCQRAIQVSNCSDSTNGLTTQKTFTKYTADGQCKPKGQRGSQDDRIICEDVTFILTPVSGGGAGLLNTYIGFIYRWAAGVVGIIAVLVIIVNAILIITSQGDSGAIEQARTRIVESLGGIAILFLSSVILYAINPNFFKL